MNARRARWAVTTLVVAATAVAGSSSAAAPGAPGGLARFLVAGRDEPGFTASAPARVSRSVTSWVEGTPADQAAADSRRYAAEGFVAATSETTRGRDGALGVSVVIEFRARAGARRELAHLLDRPLSQRFAVPGVPHAGGITRTQAASSAADVVWVEGRCTLVVGEFLPHATDPSTWPLVRAAAAIRRRSGGTCP